MGPKALTPTLLAAAQRGIRALYLQQYKQAQTGPWEPLFRRFPDAGESENYTALGAVAAMRPWTGARQYTTRRVDGLVVLSEEYDTAYSVPMIDVQRDKLGRHTGWIEAAAARAATYMVPRIRYILANGTTVSRSRCWDGAALFSASHGKDDGASQSNIISGSGADTLAHVEADLEQAISKGTTFKDDQGEYVEAIEYNTVIYPATNTTLGGIFRTLVGTRQALDQADYSRYVQSVIAEPTITGNTWYIASGGGPVRPFGWQEELEPDLEQAESFGTRELQQAVHASGQAFPADWMSILQVSNT